MVHHISYKGVEYHILGTTLVRAKINHNHEKKIAIPFQFPSGGVIDTVSSNFLSGSCHELVFSEGIKTIEAEAFINADVQEVFWPSSCDTIPENCFKNSLIEKIHNIDHVVNVGQFAFASCHIKGMLWPSACSVIPRGCFLRSDIVMLDNIEHVVSIKTLAFSNAQHLKSLDLSKTQVSDIENGAFWGLTSENVVFPYYFTLDRVHNPFSLFVARG